jgi:hypothetical protein
MGRSSELVKLLQFRRLADEAAADFVAFVGGFDRWSSG